MRVELGLGGLHRVVRSAVLQGGLEGGLGVGGPQGVPDQATAPPVVVLPNVKLPVDAWSTLRGENLFKSKFKFY